MRRNGIPCSILAAALMIACGVGSTGKSQPLGPATSDSVGTQVLARFQWMGR